VKVASFYIVNFDSQRELKKSFQEFYLKILSRGDNVRKSYILCLLSGNVVTLGRFILSLKTGWGGGGDCLDCPIGMRYGQKI